MGISVKNSLRGGVFIIVWKIFLASFLGIFLYKCFSFLFFSTGNGGERNTLTFFLRRSASIKYFEKNTPAWTYASSAK